MGKITLALLCVFIFTGCATLTSSSLKEQAQNLEQNLLAADTGEEELEALTDIWEWSYHNDDFMPSSGCLNRLSVRIIDANGDSVTNNIGTGQDPVQATITLSCGTQISAGYTIKYQPIDKDNLMVLLNE